MMVVVVAWDVRGGGRTRPNWGGVITRSMQGAPLVDHINLKQLVLPLLFYLIVFIDI